jgi:hypothetical protein
MIFKEILIFTTRFVIEILIKAMVVFKNNEWKLNGAPKMILAIIQIL